MNKVKVELLATTKTKDIYDHMKATQRSFQTNLYVLDIGTNELPFDMTRDEISVKSPKIIELLFQVLFHVVTHTIKK